MTDAQPVEVEISKQDGSQPPPLPEELTSANLFKDLKPKARSNRRPTLAELQEQLDGAHMRCQAYEAKINGLLVQNRNLSLTAQKATIKAAAYREMVKEDMKEMVSDVVHDVLTSNVQDHVATERHDGSQEPATSFTV